MEDVVRAIPPLRAVANVSQTAFDVNSPQVAQRLEALYNSLEALPSDEKLLPPQVANYVNAPIFSLLQKDELSDRQSEYVLRILGFLFRYPWSQTLTLEQAQQYISVCVYIVTPMSPGKDAEEGFQKSSIEVRTAGFNCLADIVAAAAARQIAAQLASPQTQALVVFALNGIKLGQRAEDQLAALRFLNELLKHVVIDPKPILPNTASVLNNFISNKYGFKHSQPRVDATRTLSLLLVTSFTATGEAQWVQNAAVQIDKILQNLFKEAQKDTGPLSASIVELAQSLVAKCWEPLKLCQSTLLDIIFLSSAPQALGRDLQLGSEVSASVDSKMLEYLDRLPQTLTSQDDRASLAQLSALQTYIELNPSKLFIEALVAKVQEAMPPVSQSAKNFSNDSPDSRTVVKLLESSDNTNQHSLTLGHFKVETGVQHSIQEALCRVLHQVGGTQYAELVLEELLQQVSDSQGLAQLQPLWIATTILGSRSLAVAEGYLDHAFATISGLTVGAEALVSPSVVALNTYLLGELALIPEINFQQLLVDGLFPVVDLLGSDNSLVIAEAKTALQKIAVGCDYDGVVDLILENKDYVLDGISTNLNTLNLRPATLTMLTVLIQVAGKDIVVYLEDVITSLFIILDKYHGYTRLVDGVFSVFGAVIETIGAHPLEIEPEKPRATITTLDELRAELAKVPEVDADLKESAETAQLEDLEELEAPNSDDESEKDDFEPPMADQEVWTSPYDKATYTIVKSVFDRCNIFLTHKSARLQARILHVVAASVPILATSTDLWLPKVHEIWPVVRARVLEGEIFVQEEAFRVAAALSEASGEFMSRRVEELWTDLAKSRPSNFYQRPYPGHSHEARFIASLCTSLATILAHTRLDFETVDSVLWTLRPCLLGSQVTSLGGQTGPAEALRHSLQRVNADNVWLCLESIEKN